MVKHKCVGVQAHRQHALLPENIVYGCCLQLCTLHCVACTFCAK